VTCSPTPPRGQEPSPPGSTPQSPWDFDGDDISDAVEENNANGHLGFDPFDPDANPSRARGLPWDGELDGGINLPNQGSGY
ncbi:MAG: hypothetical protein GWN16_01070, partial [Calditrichae bacterium]|nr:hypothetical protein [Calditrichia bacterium]